MIKVKRLPTPKVLDGTESKGGKEYTQWESYHNGKTNKKPRAKAYKEDEVVLKLNEMFNNKCAYSLGSQLGGGFCIGHYNIRYRPVCNEDLGPV